MLLPEQEWYLKKIINDVYQGEGGIDTSLMWQVVLIYKHLVLDATLDIFYSFLDGLSKELGVPFEFLCAAFEESMEEERKSKAIAEIRNELRQVLMHELPVIVGQPSRFSANDVQAAISFVAYAVPYESALDVLSQDLKKRDKLQKVTKLLDDSINEEMFENAKMKRLVIQFKLLLERVVISIYRGKFSKNSDVSLKFIVTAISSAIQLEARSAHIEQIMLGKEMTTEKHETVANTLIEWEVSKIFKQIMRDLYPLLDDLPRILQNLNDDNLVTEHVIKVQLIRAAVLLPFAELLAFCSLFKREENENKDEKEKDNAEYLFKAQVPLLDKSFASFSDKLSQSELKLLDVFTTFFTKQLNFYFTHIFVEQLEPKVLSLHEVAHILATAFQKVARDERISAKIKSVSKEVRS